jgi:hypothetical protein
MKNKCTLQLTLIVTIVYFILQTFYLIHRSRQPCSDISKDYSDNQISSNTIRYSYMNLNPFTSKCNHGLLLNDGCICPKYYLGNYCEEKQQVSINLPELKTCTPYSWDDNTERLSILDSSRLSSDYLDYIYRFLLWNEGRDPSNIYEKLDNEVDRFFHHIAMRHGPFQSNDAIVLNMLLEYNQMQFLENIFPDRSQPKTLMVFMFHTKIELAVHLIQTVYSPDHYFVIMISTQANMEYRQQIAQAIQILMAQSGTLNSPNIHIVPIEYSIPGEWGSISLVYMEIIAVLFSFKVGMDDWSFMINLSESHFPTRPLHELHYYLNTLDQYTTVIDSVDIIENVQVKRHIHTRLRLGDQCVFISDTPNNFFEYTNQITVEGGSQWHALSRKFWQYLFSSKIGVEILMSFRRAAIPDEIYFQTMINTFMNMNSIALVNGDIAKVTFKNENELLVYILWPGPQTINEKLFPDIHDSGAYFARKVQDLSVAYQMKEEFLNV